jgi:hypothetical protein
MLLGLRRGPFCGIIHLVAGLQHLLIVGREPRWPIMLLTDQNAQGIGLIGLARLGEHIACRHPHLAGGASGRIEK